MTTTMKSVTVYNRKGEKKVIRPNEKWLDGSYGVITINEITRINNKRFTTRVYFTTLHGEEWAAITTDCGGGRWVIKLNVLFKVS